MSIQIKAIHNQIDINLPNEPFKIWGQMIPSLENGKWDYTIERFEQTSTQCFPNENYDYDDNDINDLYKTHKTELCVAFECDPISIDIFLNDVHL